MFWRASPAVAAAAELVGEPLLGDPEQRHQDHGGDRQPDHDAGEPLDRRVEPEADERDRAGDNAGRDRA